MVELVLGELAESIGSTLHGDPGVRISGIGTLQHAKKGMISFLTNSRYKKYLSQTSASAVILGPEHLEACPTDSLVSDNPYLSYARAAQLLYPVKQAEGWIHPSAVISEGAKIDPQSRVDAHCVIGPGVVIEENVTIGPGCNIAENVTIGNGSRLVANVSIGQDIVIGKRALIHPGVVIGSDGFGIANDNGVWVKIPQLGSVQIGDDVEIGANTTIDRGALENTVLCDGVKLDNQIQIAHNVVIGAHTAIAGCVGIAGSAKIGERCMIGGAVGVLGHLEISDDVQITAMSLVSASIKSPGTYSSGVPLQENNLWRRNAARFKQLDDIAAKVRRLDSSRTEKTEKSS